MNLSSALSTCLERQSSIQQLWSLGTPLTYFNDGDVRQRFIFHTPKNPNFGICLPQKISTFLAYPKKSLSVFSRPKKIPLFFSRPTKFPASFIDGKKSLLAKISDPKNHSVPPVIKSCEWGPWAMKSIAFSVTWHFWIHFLFLNVRTYFYWTLGLKKQVETKKRTSTSIYLENAVENRY